MAETQQNTLQFTVPTSRQLWGKYEVVPDPDAFPTNSIAKLVEPILVTFSRNKTQLIMYGTPTIAYTDSSPSQERREFGDELRRVVYAQCQDLFEVRGNRSQLRSEVEREWRNIREIVPEIIEIFLNPANQVKGITRQYATNLVTFAIAVARNPHILAETVFQVGFGGSADTMPARLPSYAIPPLRIVEQLQNFYAQREKKAFESRKRWEARKLDIPEYQVTLTDAQIQEERERSAIATQMPTVRFFFPDHAAQVINGNNDQEIMEAIGRQTQQTTAALQRELFYLFPDLKDAIEIRRDIFSEDPHRPEFWQRAYLEHTLGLLLIGQYTDIASAVAARNALISLQATGVGKVGGHDGRNAAISYAAIHSLIFMDRVEIPFSSSLEGVYSRPQVSISFGGESEMRFNAVRTFLSEAVTMHGYAAFLQSQIAQGNESPTLKRLLHEIITPTTRRHAFIGEWGVPSQLPNLSVILEIGVGGTAPVYYYDADADIAYPTLETLSENEFSTMLAKHIAYLMSNIDNLAGVERSVESKIRREQLMQIIQDYTLLLEQRKRRL